MSVEETIGGTVAALGYVGESLARLGHTGSALQVGHTLERLSQDLKADGDELGAKSAQRAAEALWAMVTACEAKEAANA